MFLHVSATAGSVLGVAALQEEPRLFITFFLKVVQERRIGSRGKLARQFIQTREPREQVRLGMGRGHGFYGLFQSDNLLQNFRLNFSHPLSVAHPRRGAKSDFLRLWPARQGHDKCVKRTASPRYSRLPIGATPVAQTGSLLCRRLATGSGDEGDERGMVLDYKAPPGTSLNETSRQLLQGILRAGCLG